MPTRETPWLARSNTTAAPMETTTATSTPGTFGSQRWSTTITTSPNNPINAAAVTVFPDRIPSTNPETSPIRVSELNGEPKQLWQLAHQDRERETGHVADLGRLGEQVGDEAQLCHTGQDHHGAHQDGQHGCQCHGAGRASVSPHRGRIVAAIIGPSEESGPSTRMRDGPNAA